MIKSLFTLSFLFSVLLSFSQEDHIGSGRAILFDGIDDYIELGNIYDNVALPVTMSVWIYIDPSQGPGNLTILDSQDGSLVYNGFGMQVSNYPHVGITYGDGLGGNNPAYRASKAAVVNSITGRWIHIAGVIRNHGDMDIYFNGHNGVSNYEGSSTSPMNSNSPTETMHVGLAWGNGIPYYFKGKMDELRVWNKALTQEEIREDMCHSLTGNETGLIGYWNFDETSGNLVKDKSSNHFDGQLIGNPQRVYSGAPIGDESVYIYPSSWSGVTLALDHLSIEKITGVPYGAHLYKVKNNPSQTNGLSISASKNPYYGIFLAEDPDGKTFDFKSNLGSCKYFVRKDNSESTWTESDLQTNLLDRIELISIENTPDFEIDLGADLTLCDASSTKLTVQSSTDLTGKSFQWNSGQTTSSITVLQSGKYLVEVKSGCSSVKDSILVSFLPTPQDFSLGNDGVLCHNESRTLKPKIVKDPSFEFTWQDGSTNDSMIASDSGWYWLKVENVCGTKVDSIQFVKLNFIHESIPNIITPNGDSYNQYFVLDPALEGSKLYIINRWGRRVFESRSYHNDWDGHNLDTGVYFYYLSAPCIGELKGTIQLLR